MNLVARPLRSQAQASHREDSDTYVAAPLGAKRDGGWRGDLDNDTYTLAIRGRGDSHDLEFRQDGTANAVLTPNGGRGGIGVGAVAHALRADGFDAGEDGSGRGTPLVAETLRAGGNRTGGDRPPGSDVDTAGTYLVPVGYDVTRAVDAARCLAAPKPGAGGGGRHDLETETMVVEPITFDPTAGRDERIYEDGSSPGLKVGSGIGIPWAPAVAFHEDQRRGRVYENDHTHALRSGGGGKPGQGYQAVRQAMAVRRLTPTECEALQGFPRGYTAIQFNGKPAADGPRYRALGNSMAVVVMRWIGRRIQLVNGGS